MKSTARKAPAIPVIGVKRHYPSGPRNDYAYTYADPPSVGPRPRKRMEFWIPKGRKGGSWIPCAVAPVGNYKTRRKVFDSHNHADKLAHSIATVKACGYRNDAEAQVSAYMAWARARGLTRVHMFTGCKHAPKWGAGLELAPVDPAEFIGDAPAPEVDP